MKKSKEKGKKKGTTYYFVDSENIGSQVPAVLPEDVVVYFFLSDINSYRKVYELLEDPSFHVIDVVKYNPESKRKKNEMDLTIIACIGNLIQEKIKKKDRYVILSKDKGYDKAVQLLMENNPKLNLSRCPYNLRAACQGVEDGSLPGFILEHEVLHEQARSCDSYDVFRKSLSLGMRRKLRQFVCAGQSGWLEEDFYSGSWLVYRDGAVVGCVPSLEEAQSLLAVPVVKKNGKGSKKKRAKEQKQVQQSLQVRQSQQSPQSSRTVRRRKRPRQSRKSPSPNQLLA